MARRRRLSQATLVRTAVAAAAAFSVSLATVVTPVGPGPRLAQAASPSADVWSPPTVETAPYEDEKATRESASKDNPPPANAVAPSAGKVKISGPANGSELKELRRENAKVFATDRPGVHRAEVFSSPIHYKDGEGDWEDIESTLVGDGDESLRNKAHSMKIRFARSGAAAKLASVDFPGGLSVALGLSGSQAVQGRVDGPSVTYPGILPEVDLRLTSQAQGVKDEIILQSKSAPRVFDFPLQLRGLVPAVDAGTGAFTLTDTEGRLVARSPRGWMVDAAQGHGEGHEGQADAEGSPEHGGAISEGVEYTLLGGTAKPVLRVTLDSDWLDDEKRVFPVVVDPPIANERTTGDTFVSDDSPSTSFVGETTLVVGWNDHGTPGSYHRHRAYMKFNLSEYAGANIFNSDLRLWNWWSHTCAPRGTVVRRNTEAYDNDLATWNNQPTSTTSGGATANVSYGNEGLGCANNQILYDLTQTTRNWMGSPGKTADWVNYGLSVWSADGLTASYAKTFGSNQAVDCCWPRMYVDYDNPPATPGLSAPINNNRFTYSPTLSASYSDEDGDAGRATFTIQGVTDPTFSRTVTSVQVTHGSTASVDLGLNPLPDGWYSWSASSSDGELSSAPSGPRKFEVSSASAATPGNGEKRFYSFEDIDLADRVQLRVNVANGNVIIKAKDLAIGGTAGHDVSLDRVYNSQRITRRELGYGWSLGPAGQVGLYHAPGNAGRDLVYEDATGARYSLTWNGSGWTMPAGLDASLQVVGADYELKMGDPKEKHIFWDTGRLTLLDDKHGNRIDPQYDAGIPLLRIIDTQGRSTTYSFDTGTHLLQGVNDPGGRTTAYGYDSARDLRTARDLNGKTWSYEYDGAHRVSKITDPRGNQTRLIYHADGRLYQLIRVTDNVAGTGPTTFFRYYGAGGCPTSGITAACNVVTDPNGNPTTRVVDDKGAVTKVIDALGHKQDIGYSAAGNVETYSGNNASTPQAQLSYGSGTSQYRVQSATASDGGSSTFGYTDPDNDRSPSSYQSPQGTSLTYSYRSGDGNLESINGDRYKLEWNDNGTLKNTSQPDLTTSVNRPGFHAVFLLAASPDGEPVGRA